MTSSTTGGEVVNLVDDGDDDGKHLNISAVVVGVVGGSLFLSIVILVAVLLVRKNRMREVEVPAHTEINNSKPRNFSLASRALKTI